MQKAASAPDVLNQGGAAWYAPVRQPDRALLVCC